MPYTIVIDAGHWGSDPGAVYEGRREKDDNLSLAIAVGELLSRQKCTGASITPWR